MTLTIQRRLAVTICAVAILAPGPAAMADSGDVEPITARKLAEQRTRFTDHVRMEIRLQAEGREELVIALDHPSHVATYELTIQPGAAFPWHTHPGSVLVGVQLGELLYIYADDCVRRPYPAGTMFVDPGGDNVHTAVNPSETEDAVVVATFLDSPPEGPLTIPVDAAQGRQLDRQCDINR